MVSLDTLGALSSTANQLNLQKANSKLQAAIASLASGSQLNRASDNVADFSIATQLQTQVSSLKQASTNLAQASSQTQVADGGISQIQNDLQQLQSLATQANSPVLNPDTRKQLDQQFQQIASDINDVANNTSFNGQKLLNGDLQGDKAVSLNAALGIEPGGEGDQQLSIKSLTTASLFGNQSPNLLSADNASQAVNAIGTALTQVANTRSDVGSFQQTVNYAAASIDSAVANQEAAQSILSDTDFAETSTGLSLANIQTNATLALAAQGNRLNPALVGLLIK